MFWNWKDIWNNSSASDTAYAGLMNWQDQLNKGKKVKINGTTLQHTDANWWESIKKHGLNSDYLDPLKNGISNLWNKYTGSGLTDAERQSIMLEQNYNAEQAQQDRDFVERMSNTSYQRDVASMRAAGINPAMAMNSGGASTPSGAQASSSVSSPSMPDILGLIAGITMQNKQLAVQERIAQANNRTSLAQANIAAEASKENARVSAKVGHESNEIRSREVDQVINESQERVKLFAEQTKNERIRSGILDAQKRIEDANATEREAYANRVNDLIQSALDYQAAQTSEAKASASLKYSEQLLNTVRKNYEEKLWSDSYIDAIIDEAIASSDIRKDFRNQAELDAVFARIKNFVVRGFKPDTDVSIYRDGKEYIYHVNESVMQNVYDSLSKGMGVNGPTTYSSSTSKSESYNTQYFGGRSESSTHSTSYGYN